MPGCQCQDEGTAADQGGIVLSGPAANIEIPAVLTQMYGPAVRPWASFSGGEFTDISCIANIDCGSIFWRCARTQQPGSAGARGQHDNLAADRRSLVEVDRVLVDHADATGGHALADGPGFDRAVDAE